MICKIEMVDRIVYLEIVFCGVLEYNKNVFVDKFNIRC